MSNSDKVKSQGDSMQPLEPGQGGEAALNCKEDEKMPENSEEKAEMKVCSKSLGLEGASDLDTEKTSCDHVSTSSGETDDVGTTETDGDSEQKQNKTSVQAMLDKAVVILERFAAERHILALRDGMLASVPIILVGSTFLLLGAQSEILTKYFGGQVGWLPNLADTALGQWYLANYAEFYVPYRLTMGLLGIYIAFTIATAMAKQYNLPPVPQGLGAVAALLVTEAPSKVNFGDNGVQWGLPLKPYGPEGIFLAIVLALFVVEISRLFLRPDKPKPVKDDLQNKIPPAVGAAFGSFLPILTTVAIIWGICHVCNLKINDGVLWLMEPLKSMGDTLAAVEFSNFFLHLFAVAGIHGISVINAVMLPLWQQFVAANAEAHSAGLAMPHVTAYPFYQWFIWIGGSGATLAPTCLLFAFRNAHFRQVGKMAIVPAIFNVNEPFLFGLPVIANPVLAIPCIAAPMICGITAWFAVSLGWVCAPLIEVPWVMPGFLGAILSTQDWHSLVLFAVNFCISGVIWWPFLKYTDSQEKKDNQPVSPS